MKEATRVYKGPFSKEDIKSLLGKKIKSLELLFIPLGFRSKISYNVCLGACRIAVEERRMYLKPKNNKTTIIEEVRQIPLRNIKMITINF